MKKQKIKLGVNVDHVATLRQVRGGTTDYPDLLHLVKKSIKGGAEQVTIHLREDRRHIQLSDLEMMSKSCPVPLNLEMGATPEMFKLAKKYMPSWVCLVPEKRQELTTEGGLNLSLNFRFLETEISKLQAKGIEVSVFLEPSLEQVRLAHQLGADAVEFHTGHWVIAQGEKKKKIWNQLVQSAILCHELEMRVHAGHGLDFVHAPLIAKLPHLVEVNIGHSLICYALEFGLQTSVAMMKKKLK
ncbi:MAG: pyridoxine 5'-phosphate synthase [Pseudobdellovibrionaceae bacterium]